MCSVLVSMTRPPSTCAMQGTAAPPRLARCGNVLRWTQVRSRTSGWAATAGTTALAASSAGSGRQAAEQAATPTTRQQQERQGGAPPSGTGSAAGTGQQQLPRLRALVVVEGVSDMHAVRRAVQADVFVLGTATAAGSEDTGAQLRRAAQRYEGRVVVLTDPDVAGRQARNLLDEALGGCWHAFVPVPLATAAAATRRHEEGNVGVEHAAPRTIQRALAAPRRGDPQRQEFSRDDLVAAGLVAPTSQQPGTALLRSLVCAFLGVGDCDGKQLLRQLNRYGFTQEDLQRALQWAQQQQQQQQAEDE